ncbi:MAG: hypothetical protein CMI18_05620 [Opitutaceae bacterium]|nr:hypothetical protein [Opitutaceae bacterium]|tara:strand:+ start:3147 stop:4154 length:1008 start_codon:yes stop_codon:yes gene_type:complete
MENLICVTQWEKDTFLPNGRFEKAQSLVGPAVCVDPTSLNGGENWTDLLEKSNPEVIIAAWKTPTIPENYKEIAPRLKYVCYLPGSIRNLIPRAAIEQGLQVTSWSSSISRTISECALLMVLACMRRVRYWTEEMHFNRGWKPYEFDTLSLFERRVGVHGLGLISQGFVNLIKPFGNEVSAFSPSVPDSIFEDLGVKRSPSLESLFSDNDVIVELAALTPKTKGIVTEDLLRSMPKDAAFVNLGRGAVVDEDALAQVARERPDIQVALDVFSVEPLPLDSPFRGMKNVFLLPHLGGPTIDRRRDAADHGLENVRRFLAGEELVEPYNLNMYDRAT